MGDFVFRPKRAIQSNVGLLSWSIAFLGILLWGSAFLFGDATLSERRVGAAVGYAPEGILVPASSTPFQSMEHMGVRDLGRLVHLSGVIESRVRGDAAWVRAEGGRWILVRFEPSPRPEDLRGLGPGRRLSVNGYLEKISKAEFQVWMDSLGVRVPQPPPGRKFGDLPDPGFARVDSLFIRNFYISVRPKALATPAPATSRGSTTTGGRR